MQILKGLQGWSRVNTDSKELADLRFRPKPDKTRYSPANTDSEELRLCVLGWNYFLDLSDKYSNRKVRESQEVKRARMTRMNRVRWFRNRRHTGRPTRKMQTTDLKIRHYKSRLRRGGAPVLICVSFIAPIGLSERFDGSATQLREVRKPNR